jgi:hypothetical protein
MQGVESLECTPRNSPGVRGERTDGDGGNWGGPPRPGGLRSHRSGVGPITGEEPGSGLLPGGARAGVRGRLPRVQLRVPPEAPHPRRPAGHHVGILHQVVDERGVADVAVHEPIALVSFDLAQGGQVAGVASTRRPSSIRCRIASVISNSPHLDGSVARAASRMVERNRVHADTGEVARRARWLLNNRTVTRRPRVRRHRSVQGRGPS